LVFILYHKNKMSLPFQLETGLVHPPNENKTNKSVSKEDEKYCDYFSPHTEPMYDKHWLCNVCHFTILRYKHKMVEHVKECLKNKAVNDFMNRSYTDSEIQNLPKIETHMLWEMIVKFNGEVNDLKKTVKKIQNKQSQKIDLLEWLNHSCTDPCPEMTFTEWRKSSLFAVSNELLAFSFENGLKDGIQKCMEQLVNTVSADTYPIRAFSKQTHMFYIYESCENNKSEEDIGGSEDYSDKKQWRKMTMKDFEKWIGNIQHQFLLKYNEWEDLNQTEIEDPANAERQIRYMKIIHAEIPNLCSIRNWFYSQISKTLKRIVELDFE